jgi:hypothetical protein
MLTPTAWFSAFTSSASAFRAGLTAAPGMASSFGVVYTHSVAISNDRLLDIEDDKVAFGWKDYRDNNREKTMVLPAEELIRRFLLHVLPNEFQRIRYYGFLANRYRKQKLALCRQLLQIPPYDLYEARSEIAKNCRESALTKANEASKPEENQRAGTQTISSNCSNSNDR